MAGEIYSELAYAQGKMLDASGWSGFLPRRITPSDVDHVFDDWGAMLFAEFSSQHKKWSELDDGQVWMYQNLVKGSNNAIAALCKHSVPTTRQINTKNDVDSFHVMSAVNGMIKTSCVYDGARWPGFVLSWYDKEKRKQLFKEIQKC